MFYHPHLSAQELLAAVVPRAADIPSRPLRDERTRDTLAADVVSACQEIQRALFPMERARMPGALPARRLAFLTEIAASPDSSFTELAARMQLHRSAASVHVRGLIDEGYVLEVVDRRDRRRRRLRPTDRGREAVRLASGRNDLLRRAVAALPPVARRALNEALIALRQELLDDAPGRPSPSAPHHTAARQVAEVPPVATGRRGANPACAGGSPPRGAMGTTASV